MINIGALEDEINALKSAHEHNFYEYKDSRESFITCTKSHFNRIVRDKKYGAYLVRQLDTQKILYIGKSGTIDSQGKFKKQVQDIPRRLINIRGNIPANVWFKNVLQEKGPLKIEYIFLPTSKSPSFVEKALLQAHLNEYSRLPYKNNEL